MNYRHAFHAGNFADVLKHMALVSIVLRLRQKEKPFLIVDSHAGSGLYALDGVEAGRTKEAQGGILRLIAESGLGQSLAQYCDLVRGFGENRYPGSPLIAAKLLRAHDRLVAVEKNRDEFNLLKPLLAGDNRVRAVFGDGYRELVKLLPPPERRGLILIDPPYEDDDEFTRAMESLIDAYRRFGTGIYCWWYPLKSRGPADSAAGELLSAGIANLLRVELDVGGEISAASDEDTAGLHAAGLLIVNPPYGFAEEMAQILPSLAKHLGQGGGSGTVDRLAGS